MTALNRLRELVFEGDDNACFIERERVLNRLKKEFDGYDKPDRYALIFSRLLSEVSTPMEDGDYFAGRIKEALPDEGMNAPSDTLCATGHMSFDYESLLKYGLKGILEKIKENAAIKNDKDSLEFSQNAVLVVNAVRAYAERYSNEARKRGRIQTAEALERVPYEPAYDFYSDLQGMWLIHMIASCYIGSRDYAFGRFDEYMLPYYEKAVADGMTEREIVELLAEFFMKTNEICGRCTHNYKVKPIPSPSSKQYVNIGGENPNEFSRIVLKAAVMNNMAQPQITVLLKPDADELFTKEVFDALSKLTDKLHIYNYDLILNALVNKGIEREDARKFTFSACCTFDLNYYSYRIEYYMPMPQIFLQVIKQNEYSSLEALTADLTAAIGTNVQNDIACKKNTFFDKEFARSFFTLDCILHTDTAYKCAYPCENKAKYKIFNVFCPCVATVGDSLMVLDKLVFREKKYSYKEFIEILESNYENREEQRREILNYTKFGNDTEVDRYTVMAGNTFLDAIDALELKQNYYVIGGFYSLERDNIWDVKATPDGRRDGEPFSENQSPTYGADKNGITALLKSVAKLPFHRTATGGLNVTFSKSVSAEILKSFTVSYFQMGGLHIGISVADAKTLKDAMKFPDKYKSLTVRLYGFSEYFVSLPEWQQLAILKRTAYEA